MTVEQVRVQKKEIKAKDLDSESHWELEIEVEKLTIWLKLIEQLYEFHQNRLINVKISKDNISR